jgi:hypothetical protein
MTKSSNIKSGCNKTTTLPKKGQNNTSQGNTWKIK